MFFLKRISMCTALRECLKKGYHWSDFRSDVLSGIVVGMIAIPLGMALAIASGVSPQYGLYTVMIAGFLVALLGGSRFQVTGPTAAFVVILVPVLNQFGFGGLLVAGGMAGVILFLMGLFGVGKLIRFIPYTVIVGFTAGIAVVIATIQLKDFFGLTIFHMPENYFYKVTSLFIASQTFSFKEFVVGLMTLAGLILFPRITKRVPAPLVILTAITIIVLILRWLYPSFDVATIGNRFSTIVDGITERGIPNVFPKFQLPWLLAGPEGKPLELTFKLLVDLFPSALLIAFLGAIESLLSATMADHMANTKHHPNGELMAIGIGNILSPFFGGIAATGAIARTAANIKYGARSPISAMIHALFTVFVVLFFSSYMSYLPMAALAAMLLIVAFNMSEVSSFISILKKESWKDVLELIACFLLTVFYNMVLGVAVGIGLHILFLITAGKKRIKQRI